MTKHSDRGVITLEACISVLSFLTLMLFLSSLFVMFMAQNVTGHVALQTAESLSLDVYRTNTLIKEDGKFVSLGDSLTQFITKNIGSSEKNPNFITDTRWYQNEEGDDPEPEVVAEAVKNRFLGYLSGGDETKADELLKNMNVVNGFEGLDFSGCYVEGRDLYVVVKYELEYDFNLWNVENQKVEQMACSKLWK